VFFVIAFLSPLSFQPNIQAGDINMVNTTPLLLLLDGILSQDDARTNDALRQLCEMVPLPPLQESPLRSASSLELIIRMCMTHHPQLAHIASTHDGSLPLHFASSIGNVRVAKLLMEQNRKAACTPNSKGKIPLHYAAREGRVEMVIAMLRMVPETASILSKKGKLALHFAAGEGHTEVCQALLKVFPKGASLPSGKGKVPIHFAARWGQMEIAKSLVKVFPGCVSILDYEGSLPLHDAAREGQLEMAKFLIEIHPDGVSQENIRGETPLFPAIRSENQDLCEYLLKAWPKGGSHVLQRIREEDEVEQWPENVLDLCLRGGIESLQHSGLNPGKFQLSSDQKIAVLPTPLSDAENDACSDSGSLPSLTPAATPNLDINLPRSKSPILEDGGSRKKRSAEGDAMSSNKRSRRGSFDEQDTSEWPAEEAPRFRQVHAALQCGASPPVIACVLERYPKQLQEIDDLGKLPLHIAVGYLGSKEDSVFLLIEKIWKPFKEACWERDFLGRLPLHLALISNADSRIVERLLETNPSSGVDICDVVDPRFVDKLPLDIAMAHQCSLSSIYLLLRGDPSVIKEPNISGTLSQTVSR
jgi:ankyrin repeat protein